MPGNELPKQLWRGLLDWRSEILELFLRVKSDRKASSPLHALYPHMHQIKIFKWQGYKMTRQGLQVMKVARCQHRRFFMEG